MNKIKLLYLVTKCTKSGPINVIYNILKNIDKEKYDITLVTINEEGPNTMLSTMVACVNQYYHVPLTKSMIMLGRLQPLKTALDTILPDVIHSTGLLPDLAINRLTPNKQVIIIHSNVKKDNPAMYGRLLGRIMVSANFKVFREARFTIACSESLKNQYLQWGIDVPFVRNGVDIYPIERVDKNELRQKLGLPIVGKIFVYCAGFIPIKNHEFLINVFSEFDSDKILVLLGDGPLFEKIRRMNKSKNIIFIGNQNNVIPYLQASDYYISSSLQEGMPMGVIEGMSYGLPLVLSNIPQHNEIFELCGNVGLQFVNGSIESATNAIKKVLLMDYNTISAESYETAKHYFDSKNMTRQYEKYYSRVAERNNN